MSPSETGIAIASSASATRPAGSSQRSEGEQVHSADLLEIARSSSTARNEEEHPVRGNESQPVVQPPPGPSRGTTRIAILLVLIIIAGIALPVAFAEPTSMPPLPRHSRASSSSWTWTLTLLPACCLLLATRAAAQVPNVVVPAKMTTTEEGGPVYTVTLCNVHQAAQMVNDTEKRWVPLTCGAVARRPGMSVSKLVVLAVLAAIALIPTVAASQTTPPDPALTIANRTFSTALAEAAAQQTPLIGSRTAQSRSLRRSS